METETEAEQEKEKPLNLISAVINIKLNILPTAEAEVIKIFALFPENIILPYEVTQQPHMTPFFNPHT